MKKLEEVLINGREGIAFELPYSKERIVLVKRIKGRDLKGLTGDRGFELEDLQRFILSDPTSTTDGQLVIDDMDLLDIGAVSDYVTELTERLNAEQARMVETKKK